MRTGATPITAFAGVMTLARVATLAGSGCANVGPPPERKGTMAEVAPLRVEVRYREDDQPDGPPHRWVYVSNQTTDGSCLVLDGLRVRFNGQTGIARVNPGGRLTAGRLWFPLLGPPADCVGASIELGAAYVEDPQRTVDALDLSDGTRSVRLEAESALSGTRFDPPPPASLTPGQRFEARILPELPGRTVAGAVVSYHAQSGSGQRSVAPLAVQALRSGAYAFTLPADAPVGPAVLTALRAGDPAERVPVSACTADICEVAREGDRATSAMIQVRAAAPTGGP